MARSNPDDKTAPAETPVPEKAKEPTDPHARFKTTLPNGTTLYNFVR